MPIWTQVTAALRSTAKAFQMVFARAGWGAGWNTGWGGAGWWGARSTRDDYRAVVGDGRGNSIVQAVVAWVARNFPEAPLEIVQRSADGQDKVLETHPLVVLLERPNPYYSGTLLWMATLGDWLGTGNAYWLKVRSGSRKVVALWWVPSYLMEPCWPPDGSVFIDHYDYSPNGRPIRLDPADVVHFRYGIDAENHRKGCSPLATLLHEVFTDDEASRFTAALLRNLGVPGVIISPKDTTTTGFTPADAEVVKQQFMQKFGGAHRGEPLILDGAVTAQVLSFSPEQMNLRDLRQVPEERISAVFGVPAIVAGLGAGLSRSTFANFREAREAAYEENIIPTQRLLAADLTTQLLDDFGKDPTIRIRFDLSQVRVLQDDQNALMTRAAEGFQKGILTRGEARTMVGQAQQPEDDVFALPVQLGLIPRDQTTEPTPPALPAPAEPLALPPGKGLKVDETVRITGTDVAHARRWIEELDGAPELQAALGLGTNGNGNGQH